MEKPLAQIRCLEEELTRAREYAATMDNIGQNTSTETEPVASANIQHAHEIDVFSQMHSDGGVLYIVYVFPLPGYHRSRFFIVTNRFDLSSDDQHILHHLFPQGKVFAVVELLDFNSCSRC